MSPVGYSSAVFQEASIKEVAVNEEETPAIALAAFTCKHPLKLLFSSPNVRIWSSRLTHTFFILFFFFAKHIIFFQQSFKSLLSS